MGMKLEYSGLVIKPHLSNSNKTSIEHPSASDKLLTI